MNISKLSYLLTDVFFAGLAIIIIWHRHRPLLKKHWEFVMDFTLFAIPFAYLDSFAIKWGAYKFNPDKNLNVHLYGALLEDYVFLALVAAAIASYTISTAKVYGLGGKKKSKKRRNKKQPLRPRSFFVGVGGARR